MAGAVGRGEWMGRCVLVFGGLEPRRDRGLLFELLL